MHNMSIAPLFSKRMSAALAVAWLIVAFAPLRTRADSESLSSVLFAKLASPLAPPKLAPPKKVSNDDLVAEVDLAKHHDLGHCTYGLMFAHVSLPAARANARALLPLPKMQSPSHSVTLHRGSTTLHTLPSTPPPKLSIDQTPVLGQMEQVAVDMAPVFMLMIMVLLAGSSY